MMMSAFTEENFHRAVNVGRFRTVANDNGAGFVLQLGIFYRIAANARYRRPACCC